MKITAPNPDYNGTDNYGDGTSLVFENGTAEVDELSPGVRGYLASVGYGIDGEKADKSEPEPTPADPRDLSNVKVGTPLRDAAVDPQPEDFLPPINAGLEGEDGNPHGPNVVAPGIHALKGQAIVPGPVDDGQEARETELAERTLIGDESVQDVVASLAEDNPQPAPKRTRAKKAD